jgi:hypothetical protein
LTLLPWEYFWIGFNKFNFPDLFDQVWMGSGILLIVLIAVYMVRTKALHRHRPYLDMWEWIFWSGLITYFLLIVGALFQFDFAVILVIMVSGLGAMAYARFRRYPPLFEAYEHQLARQRYLARARTSHPEATIRQKGSRAKQRKRR